MKATHILTTKFDTARKLANRVIKALNDICDYDNGTLRNPFELASVFLSDGRTLIQTIYEDKELCYNDGWYVVELFDDILYVDLTTLAVNEMGLSDYSYITDFSE